MKTLSICAVILFSIFTNSSSLAQKQVIKETIKVWGNCGMCKTTIETSAKEAGAITAGWNKATKLLNVSYATSRTTGEKIQQNLVAADYDTQNFTADNKAYDNLNSCCGYEGKKDTGFNLTDKKACNIALCCDDLNTCKEMTGCKDKEVTKCKF